MGLSFINLYAIHKQLRMNRFINFLGYNHSLRCIKVKEPIVCPVTYIMQVAVKDCGRCIWRFDDNVQTCVVSKEAGCCTSILNYVVYEYKK